MSSQREKIEGLEKLVTSQETLIVNQTEKLKEHDTLFAEISKRPKDQRKINVLTCTDKIGLERSTKCYDKLKAEGTSSYIPQLIIQQPPNDKVVSGICKNIEVGGDETMKHQLKCFKRKAQGYIEDQSSIVCKRTRSNNSEDDIDSSILRCGALAAIVNKKK